MPEPQSPSRRLDLLQGTLELLILQTLRWGPQHGYSIATAIRSGSNDALQVETGSLYPALHRLERQKFVKASWETSVNSQRTRVYRLTVSGKKHLEAERSRWEAVSAAMMGILSSSKPARLA